MSQPIHSPHERSAASDRLERAGLDPNVATAVIEEVDRGKSRFATTEQVAKIEVGLAVLQGEVRAVEARLGGRIDVLTAEIDSLRTSVDARFDAVDARFEAVDARFEAVEARIDGVHRRIDDLRDELLGRMDTQFGTLRRENRLLFLFLSTMLGLLIALFRLGVL